MQNPLGYEKESSLLKSLRYQVLSQCLYRHYITL